MTLVVILIILYVNTLSPSAWFPKDTNAWNKILTAYMVVFTLSLVVAYIVAKKVVLALTEANYWRAVITGFVPNFVANLVFLIIIKGLIKGSGSINLLSAISYMPWYIVVITALVVAQVEEFLFGGLLYTVIDEKSGEGWANGVTALLFGLWHFAKTGGSFIALATYIPLRLWFNYTRTYGSPLMRLPKIGHLFTPTPKTQQANAGQHFAWNLFVIGFIKPFQ